MAEQTYRIKPLDWEEVVDGTWRAWTVFGWVSVWPGKRGWWTCSNRAGSFRGAESAKSAAETHCRERLMVALEVVDE